MLLVWFHMTALMVTQDVMASEELEGKQKWRWPHVDFHTLLFFSDPSLESEQTEDMPAVTARQSVWSGLVWYDLSHWV